MRLSKAALRRIRSHAMAATVTALLLLGAVTGLEAGSRFAEQVRVKRSVGPPETEPAVERDARIAPDVRSVVRGETAFACAIYGHLRSTDGNVLIAPHGLSTALAMTGAGLRDEAADRMLEVLNQDLPRERLHAAVADLARRLAVPAGPPGGPPAVELLIANRLWADEAAAPCPDFVADVARWYHGGLERVTFDDEGRRVVNAWAAEHTRDRIRDLLHEEDVGPETMLVLTNAIAFTGRWATPFDAAETRDEPFRARGRAPVTVPMMSRTLSVPHLDAPELQAIELPYAGERFSMLVLLAHEPDGLPALEMALTPANLARWIEDLETRPVRVAMPRFALETRFDLRGVLASMGMPLDASSLFCPPAPEAFIDHVLHQVRVEIDERGTEAAGATAAVVARGGPTFRADHPFLFLVRDRETDAVLFLGRVVDPRDGARGRPEPGTPG